MQGLVVTSLGRLGRLVLRPGVGVATALRLLALTFTSPIGQRRAAQRAALKATLEQLMAMGVRTVSPVLKIGFSIGLVGSVQLLGLLAPLIESASIWSLLVTLLLRELAPLVTAMLVAVRAGTVMASDVARMNVSEELDALRTMGVSPLHHVLLPRFMAMILSTMALGFFLLLGAAAGAGLVALVSLSMPTALFLDYVIAAIAPVDVILFLIKGFVFGLTIATLAAMRGLEVEGSSHLIPKAVSQATLQGVGGCVLVDTLFNVVVYFKLPPLVTIFQ